MNFLVSKNPILIQQYWSALLENGNALLLSNYADLLWRAKTSEKSLVLLDTQIDGFAGMENIASLKRINQNIKVLIIAAEVSTEDELSALSAGASGSCKANLQPEKIRQIFNTVQDGGIWISNTALPHLLQRLKRLETLTRKKSQKDDAGHNQQKIASLTPREREIVELIASGDSNKIIASKLNIADRTVKAHLSVIFQKLNVHDRLQLALFANNTLGNTNRANA